MTHKFYAESLRRQHQLLWLGVTPRITLPKQEINKIMMTKEKVLLWDQEHLQRTIWISYRQNKFTSEDELRFNGRSL